MLLMLFAGDPLEDESEEDSDSEGMVSDTDSDGEIVESDEEWYETFDFEILLWMRPDKQFKLQTLID